MAPVSLRRRSLQRVWKDISVKKQHHPWYYFLGVLVPVTSLLEACVIFNCRTESTDGDFRNAAIDDREFLPAPSSQPLSSSLPLPCAGSSSPVVAHNWSGFFRVEVPWPRSLGRKASAGFRTRRVGGPRCCGHGGSKTIFAGRSLPLKPWALNWTWNCRCRWDGSTVLCGSNVSFKVFLIILSHAWN